VADINNSGDRRVEGPVLLPSLPRGRFVWLKLYDPVSHFPGLREIPHLESSDVYHGRKKGKVVLVQEYVFQYNVRHKRYDNSNSLVTDNFWKNIVEVARNKICYVH
jgi:hypothetical protein